MNNEIKEIINDLQRVADRKCYPEDILDGSIAQEWVDYITNLQEENEQLMSARYSLDRVDLEQRIDKAIEYINNYLPNYDFDKTNLIKLLEILDKEK